MSDVEYELEGKLHKDGSLQLSVKDSSGNTVVAASASVRIATDSLKSKLMSIFL